MPYTTLSAAKPAASMAAAICMRAHVQQEGKSRGQYGTPGWLEVFNDGCLQPLTEETFLQMS
jgi:hypothetical protein